MAFNPIHGTSDPKSSYDDDYVGDLAPSVEVSYYCPNGHITIIPFVADVSGNVPKEWHCKKCRAIAGVDPNKMPNQPKVTQYKTHWDYLMERRSIEQGDKMIAERLKILYPEGLEKQKSTKSAKSSTRKTINSVKTTAKTIAKKPDVNKTTSAKSTDKKSDVNKTVKVQKPKLKASNK